MHVKMYPFQFCCLINCIFYHTLNHFEKTNLQERGTCSCSDSYVIETTRLINQIMTALSQLNSGLIILAPTSYYFISAKLVIHAREGEMKMCGHALVLMTLLYGVHCSTVADMITWQDYQLMFLHLNIFEVLIRMIRSIDKAMYTN